MGLGASDRFGRTQSRVPEKHCEKDLESYSRRGEICARAVSCAARPTLSQFAGKSHVSPCGRNPGNVSQLAAQAARDAGAAEVSGDLHYWNWLAAERWLSARDARCRLRRLDHRHK